MLPYQHLCICLNPTLDSTADRDTASWRPEKPSGRSHSTSLESAFWGTWTVGATSVTTL